MTDYSMLSQLSDNEWRAESRMYPGSYAGYHPGDDGYLRVGIGRSRDSSTLEESNYASAIAILRGDDDAIEDSIDSWIYVDSHGCEHESDGRAVLEHCASHWAVGWVESIWIADVPELRELVRDMWASLESYPVLDDMGLSERESAEFLVDCGSWFRIDIMIALENDDRESDADIVDCASADTIARVMSDEFNVYSSHDLYRLDHLAIGEAIIRAEYPNWTRFRTSKESA